jgi:hypothetical protein
MTYDLSCDFLKLLTSCRPTVSTSDPRAAAGVDGTSLVFYERASQFSACLDSPSGSFVCAVVARWSRWISGV